MARARAFRWGFWVLAGALLFNLMLGDMGVLQGLRQRRAAARLRAEVAALQSEHDALSTEVKGLNNDPFRIEALAREDIGLARPGEIIFLFPPDGTRRDTPATAGSARR